MVQKVVLITTGGTIASKRNEFNKLESGKMSGDEILALCDLDNDIEIELIDLFQLPSMHMTFENLNRLNEVIHEQLQDENVLLDIVDSFDVTKKDLIIEVGPGAGALTKYLKNLGCKVLA